MADERADTRVLITAGGRDRRGNAELRGSATRRPSGASSAPTWMGSDGGRLVGGLTWVRRRLVVLAISAVLICTGGAATGQHQEYAVDTGPDVALGRSDRLPHGSRADPPRSVNVLDLGDSVTAGASCDCVSFPTLYARAQGARQGLSARLTNAGVSGATSSDVQSKMGSRSGAAAVRSADIVMLTIGANDFTGVSGSVLQRYLWRAE